MPNEILKNQGCFFEHGNSDTTSLNERSPQEWPSSSPDRHYLCCRGGWVYRGLLLLGYNLMAAIYLSFCVRGAEGGREGFEFIFVLTNCPSLYLSFETRMEEEKGEQKSIFFPGNFLSPHSLVGECRRYLVCMKNVAAMRDPFRNRFSPSFSQTSAELSVHR